MSNIRSGASGTQARSRYERTRKAYNKYTDNIAKVAGVYNPKLGFNLIDSQKQVSRRTYMGLSNG